MIKVLLACVILNLFFRPQMLHMEIVACPFSCQVIISLALGDRDCARHVYKYVQLSYLCQLFYQLNYFVLGTQLSLSDHSVILVCGLS